MILVDSSVWIDYFNGRTTPQTELLDDRLGIEPLVVGDVILTEVLQGFQSDKDFAQAKRLLDSLVFVEMLGRDQAIQSAQNYRILRRKGVTVRKTLDVIIGTSCIAHRLPLLHSDKDFDPIERHLGLKVVR
jgi:predicted nucleic acid-binding protein